MDICADALGFSARYRTVFPQETAQKDLGIPRGFVREMVKATCVVKSLVKLSQFCYGFKDVHKYRKSVDACENWLISG